MEDRYSVFIGRGVPFDIGMHFTAGLDEGGLLDTALKVFDIRDAVIPEFLDQTLATRMVFEQQGEVFEMPYGVEAYRSALKTALPEEAQAVDRYFEMLESVRTRTNVTSFYGMLTMGQQRIDEDYITLQHVLDGLTKNKMLQAILASYCFCYGVKPSEVSFASHCRMAIGLYQSMAHIKDGGAALIRAFKQKLELLPVDICCGVALEYIEDVKSKHAHRFVLSNGEIVTATQCVLAIHPENILEILPKEALSPAFMSRISSFEPSSGFFSVYACLQPEPTGVFKPLIELICPGTDVDAMFEMDDAGHAALVLLQHREGDNCVINASEVAHWEQVAKWEDSVRGQRSGAYLDYKQNRIDQIHTRIIQHHPEYRSCFSILDAASMLTYKDYLHSPDGSAYGIKQKIGQMNVFGRLPIRNIYAVGQSAMLPGIIGALISSVLVCRTILGDEAFGSFLKERKLCQSV